MQTATATPTAPAKKPGLFINRNFGLLWIGQTISYVGDFVFDTTLVFWIATSLVRGQSWAPLAVSGVLLAVSVPVFAVGPLAGVFVDRWDKRRTMLAMDALRAMLVFLLLLASEKCLCPS
jgi:MFS family permease